MTNSTQRFFMVKVTGCKDCPKANHAYLACMEHPPRDDDNHAEFRFYKQNFSAITPSCPMYPQSQEVEK